FHPEFLALCGYFCLQPVACARRDPESKGVVEGGVRYIKHNALAGRGDELTRFEDYLALAPYWRDQVANLRQHETTHERPLDRFQQERALLRPLPALPCDTDEIVPAVVSPHARIAFDGNRHSVPPQFVRRLLNLAQLYGRTEVLAAITRALALASYDAAYVENLLLAERRRRQLPTPTLPTPQRRELIDDIELEPADPARYDRFCHDTEE